MLGPRRGGRVICSLGVATYGAILETTLGTFARYSRIHGYALHVEWDDAGLGRPPAWGKIRLIQRLLQSFEEVLWIDADAAVVRFDVDISDVVPPGANMALAVHSYFNMELPNTGVMYWRRTSQSVRLLAEAWAQTHLIDHPYWEQAALLELIGYDVTHTRAVRMIAPTSWHEGVHYLGSEWNTTRRSASPRPRIVHCAGEAFERRMQLLSDVAVAAIRSPNGLDYPGYPGHHDGQS